MPPAYHTEPPASSFCGKTLRGFSLLELLVVVVIISALALIASPYLTGATSKAKITAVKGNVANGAMTAAVLLNLDEVSPEKAVEAIIEKGNYPDIVEGGDASGRGFVPSPFDQALKAFGGDGPGQVDVRISEEPYGVVLQGFDGKGKPIATAKKFVPFAQ